MNRTYRSLCTCLLALVLLVGCSKGKKERAPAPPNRFADPELVRIYQLQDKGDTEGLLLYFEDISAERRAAAALAFASVQDSSTMQQLSYLLLDDDSSRVRRSAAFAIGQLGRREAAAILSRALDQEEIPIVRREIMEALGKSVGPEDIDLLGLDARENDSLELEGLAWGCYRAGIREVHNDRITRNMVRLLDSTYAYPVRLGAAHYLARSPKLQLSAYAAPLLQAAHSDRAANVRMACMTALKNIKTKAVLRLLQKSCVSDPDYRVRINALRSLGNFSLSASQKTIEKALSDSHVPVRITAAQLVQEKSGTKHSDWLGRQVEKSENPRVRALLFSALVQHDEGRDSSQQVKEAYQKAKDPYEKALLLQALEHDLMAYPFVVTETYRTSTPVVSTAGVNTLINMRRKKDFPEDLKEEFADIFKTIIETGDLAMVGLVSQLIADPGMDFKNYYEHPDFLREARSKLHLPRDNEAVQHLETAIAFFEGIPREEVQIKNTYNHPIDWSLVRQVSKGQRARIQSSKGIITIELMIETAPGSTANFITLAKAGYYDEKYFHRVVPNFVAQGGCHRGDGWGSEDYSLRSEFSLLHYDTGYIGMASAGKDTEGTQWFITHSPTPHLDGRYTIFAKVVEGMAVVHALEMGDHINSVQLL